MSRWTDATVVGSCYADDALPWSHQETINYLLVKAEAQGTRSASKLRGVPGMVSFSQLEAAPVRGMHDVEGLLLVVCGRSLYRVDAKGAATRLGTIPGVARVSMAHNQITGGNEVAIANGQSGYVYNTVTGQLTQISDDAFPGSISFDYVDSYITGIEPARRFAYISDLADATSYSTLDYYEAEGSPDALVGQIVTHREWWLFGTRTIEPYTNTGAATGTFQRQAGMVIERGAASTFGIANLDNSPFWVGDDGIVYRANGYTPQRISTMPIEQALSACNLAQCFAFTFEDQGHKVFYITCPDGKTFGYDVASGEWHRRKSEGLDRWRINALVKASGKWIAGDYANGKLYVLDWATQDEDGAILERRRTTGILNDAQNNVIVNGVDLVIDTGLPVPVAQWNPMVKVTGHVPGGTVGDPVSYQYIIAATIWPAVATITAGSLPPGLSMDAYGLVTGTYTQNGTFSWTVGVTDGDGTPATLDDSTTVAALAPPADGFHPDTDPLKYLLSAYPIVTTYMPTAYDDTAWPYARMPLGTADRPDAATHGFSPTVQIPWPLSQACYLRGHFTMSKLQDMKLSIYVDDAATVYINGVSVGYYVADGTPPTYYYQATIPAASFVVGDNVISLMCDGSIYAVNNFIDFRLEPA